MAVRPSTLAPNSSDVQHVSAEVLEQAMASLHAARVALSDEREERTSDFRTRVPGGHGTVAANGSYDTMQGFASTVEASDFCKQHGFQVSMRFNPRNLGDRAAGILARVERPTPIVHECCACRDTTLKATYTQPPEFTDHASTPGERLAWEVGEGPTSVSRLMPRHIWRDEQLK